MKRTAYNEKEEAEEAEDSEAETERDELSS